MKASVLRSVSLLALASCALAARANIVTFDTTAVDTIASPGSLDIEGLTFTTTFYERVHSDADLAANGASNGTQALINGNGAPLTITRTGGGAFTFTGLDYGQSYYSNSTDPLTINLNLAAGGVQVYNVTSTTSFQTLTASALVSSVVVSPNSGYFVIDNVGYSAVPGPVAALPFALMALRRRKRA